VNAIAPRHATSIAATPPAAPRLSSIVNHAMQHALNPVIGRGAYGDDDPGFRPSPPLLAPAEWAEAQRAADALDAMMSPVTPALVAAWLIPVNLASRNPQTPEQFAMRAAAIAEIVGDLPAAAFTAEARRNLGTGFFPAADDVRNAVGPVAMEWARQRDALRRLHQAEAAQSPRGSAEERAETMEERKAYGALNRATIEAMKDELASKQRKGEPIKPNHLSPTQRIAAYRAMGQHAVADAIAAHHATTAA